MSVPPSSGDVAPALRFETRQVHAGSAPDPATGARATPIYQTTSYVFDSSDHAAELFALSRPGNIYTRMMNPTTAVLEERVASLEGGAGALAVASGQSAITLAILNIASAGHHVVSSSAIYGGTHNLLAHTLRRYGIETTFVDDASDLDQWRRSVRPNTRLLFAESIANPRTEILDVPAVATIAHQTGVPLVVDNTLATPYLVRPFEHGADIVVHSATKFLGGHGAVLGGLIVDGGRFPWSAHADRFPGLAGPDASYGGIRFTDAVGDESAFVFAARVQLLRDLGPALAPASAWQLLQGVETLSLRMERHTANARTLAEHLEQHPAVSAVHHAGLPSSPWHELASRLAPDGVGAVFSFELRGGVDAGRRVVERLRLFSHLANVGDVRSLVIHPASTTHAQLDADAMVRSGIMPGLVRLSVGIENVDDLIDDLDQALEEAGR